jgi:hypothetical protein
MGRTAAKVFNAINGGSNGESGGRRNGCILSSLNAVKKRPTAWQGTVWEASGLGPGACSCSTSGAARRASGLGAVLRGVPGRTALARSALGARAARRPGLARLAGSVWVAPGHRCSVGVGDVAGAGHGRQGAALQSGWALGVGTRESEGHGWVWPLVAGGAAQREGEEGWREKGRWGERREKEWRWRRRLCRGSEA